LLSEAIELIEVFAIDKEVIYYFYFSLVKGSNKCENSQKNGEGDSKEKGEIE
jgi:hypothetical protein